MAGAAAVIKRASSRSRRSAKPRSGVVTTQAAGMRIGGASNLVAARVIPRTFHTRRQFRP